MTPTATLFWIVLLLFFIVKSSAYFGKSRRTDISWDELLLFLTLIILGIGTFGVPFTGERP